MNQEKINQLRAPFPYEQVEAKVQVTSGDKTKGLAVFYLDARAVQERLDTVLGPFGWRNEYLPWQDKAQICGLSIYNSERDEWVVKYDGADNSDIEAVKGGLTDAFKRSAVLWGVGRYLYQMDGIWVEVEQRGKGSFIKDNQQGKLKGEYDKAVARIFGTAALKQGTSTGGYSKQAPPSNNAGQPPVPPSDQNTAPPPAAPADSFTIKSVKKSGQNSQLLELISSDGEIITAYVNVGAQGIKAGAGLNQVKLESKKSSYGPYNLISSYQVAA